MVFGNQAEQYASLFPFPIYPMNYVSKYIDMVLNKQQLFAPGGKTPEKESVLKKLEQFQQKKSHHKTTSTPPNREESL